MPDWSVRGVVEEPRFTQDVDTFRQNYPRFDDVLRWIAWELARNPIAGETLPQFPDFRVLKTEGIQEGIPNFRVLYTFDTEKVYLHAIEPVADDKTP
jgi:hypothetical protein